MIKEVEPPSVWYKLGGFMHQDYSIMYPDFWDGYKEFWQSISPQEKDELVNFLSHANDKELAGGMQKKYWHLSGAQVLPSKIKPFLAGLLSKANEYKHNNVQENT